MEEVPKYDCAYDELVEIHKLQPNPKNNNKHSEDQIERLAKIINYQGQRAPIVVSKRSGFIVKGHCRLESIKKLGWDKVAVDYQDYESEAQEYADMTADNAIASWAVLDLGQINLDIQDLGPDLDIDMLAIKDFEIEPLDRLDPQCDEDAVPEVKHDPVTKRGDIWLLGDHRVMCGDSTIIDDVEKLMNGEKAKLYLTDPPYGVSYTDKNEYLNSIGGGDRLTNAIKNDHKTPEEMKVFWDDVFSCAHSFLLDNSSYYIFSPQGGDLLLLLLQAVRDSGFQLKHVLVWAKNNHVLGRCDYNYKHEPIVYGWKQKGTHEFIGGGEQKTSVWQYNKPLKNDLHPTMKPVEVLENAIMNSSKKKDLILDQFLGSGSTLIACEKTNRRCYGMELDEHYCDVIVKRWQDYTGKEAVLESSFEKYNDLAK